MRPGFGCGVTRFAHQPALKLRFLDQGSQSAKLRDMGERKRIGSISLGVTGQRRLARLAQHPCDMDGANP